MSAEFRAIRAAVECLPSTCRYHGDEIEPYPASTREACCDTGVPALRRRRAEEALARLEEVEVRP